MATNTTMAINATNATMTYVCNGCDKKMKCNENHCNECKKKLFPKSSAVQSTIAKVPRPPKSCRKGVGCRWKGCNLVHECRYGVNCRCLQPGSTSRCIYYHHPVDAHLALFGPEDTYRALCKGRL